ncbi:MAG: ribosome silencing factor [Actinobacteria bacterium]|nr:ribosome silencing factor [Actinomycetota bacterium]
MVEESTLPEFENLTHRQRPSLPASPAELAEIHERAMIAARAATDVKADDVRILDMHDLVTYTDYLVVCTGRNPRLTKRISEEVGFRLKQERGLVPAGVEGATGGEWILMDYLDFVVHIFTPQARDFYRLDVLWKQAPMEAVI